VAAGRGGGLQAAVHTQLGEQVGRVGPRGSVLGLDLDPRVLELATQEVEVADVLRLMAACLARGGTVVVEDVVDAAARPRLDLSMPPDLPEAHVAGDKTYGYLHARNIPVVVRAGRSKATAAAE
jgi:hypothetical protein